MVKKDTKGMDYADRLKNLSGAKWKQLLDVQRPYRWNINRLNPGKTLDIGCGIGRNLKSLAKDSVGVDHNKYSIKIANEAGLTTYQTNEFFSSSDAKKNSYDSILLAHVIEHMNAKDNKNMLEEYIPYLKKNGQIIIICPQEKGFTTDATHVSLYNFYDLAALFGSVGFTVKKSYSFPFPRFVGKMFTYNEFVVVATKSTEKNN